MAYSPFTSEFHQEFAQETHHLLHRRFLWFTGVMAGLTLLFLVTMALRPARLGDALPPISPSSVTPTPGAEQSQPQAGPPAPESAPRRGTAAGRAVREIAREVAAPPSVNDVMVTLVRVVNFLAFFGVAMRVRPQDAAVLKMTFAAVIIDGALLIGARLFDATAGFGIAAVAVSHLLACCFLPWSWRQALAPMAVLLVLDAAVVATLAEPAVWKVWTIMLSTLLALPGMAICWLRTTRRMAVFKMKFLERRLGSLRQELIAARRVHEALFPKPEGRGLLRFDYRYTPMRLIGGDYLHARFCSVPGVAPGTDQAFTLLLLDVTGHGIPAALTVNRLYGELERLHAEDPAIDPGTLLRALNRYIYLTLSDHALFVTAMAVRFEPAEGRLVYANAGHPPAFVRGADGTLDQMDSTACVLGVFKDREFDPAPSSRPFGPGDVLIAYTDGAMEVKNSAGRMLGVDGLRRALLSAAPGRPYAQQLMEAVDRHRAGPIADDTLIVEVYRELTPIEPGHGAGGGRSGVFTNRTPTAIMAAGEGVRP